MDQNHQTSLSEYQTFCSLFQQAVPELTQYQSILPQDSTVPAILLKMPEKTSKSEDLNKGFIKLYKTFEFELYYDQSNTEETYHYRDQLVYALLDNKKVSIIGSEYYLMIQSINTEADYENKKLMIRIDTEQILTRTFPKAEYKIKEIQNKLMNR